MLVDDVLQAESIPEAVKRAFWLADPPLCNEQILWREVAARLILDAVGMTPSWEANDDMAHRRVVFEARQWLRDESEDVREVFDLAGVSHDGIAFILLSHRPRTN